MTKKQLDSWITKVTRSIDRTHIPAQHRPFFGGDAGDGWRVAVTDGHRALLSYGGDVNPDSRSAAPTFTRILQSSGHGATITPAMIDAVRMMRAANPSRGGYLFLTGLSSSIRFATCDETDQTQATVTIDASDAPIARQAVDIKYLSNSLVVGGTLAWSYDCSALVVTPPAAGFKVVIMSVRASHYLAIDMITRVIVIAVESDGSIRPFFEGVEGFTYQGWRHFFACGIGSFADGDLIRIVPGLR